MTLLDTHIWIWWSLGEQRLGRRLAWLDAQPVDALCLSVISIWEVAMLVAKGRLTLPFALREWIDKALVETAVALVPLSKDIAVESQLFAGPFHPDPADRFIVATANQLGCDLLTADARILSYPHVKAIAP